jgi:ribose/xylose/arabinose/galactoside ABC-type transport system permease subunit
MTTSQAQPRFSSILQTWGLPIALLLIGAAMSFAHPAFLTTPNLINVARQVSINGILAVGVTLVLLTGGVDLSLGSVVALAGVVAASLAQAGAYPVFVVVAAGVAAGACCGAINGVVVTRGRVPSFIATLGMMTAARGLALVVSNGRPVSNLSPDFTRLGGDLGRLPIPVIVLAVVAWRDSSLQPASPPANRTPASVSNSMRSPRWSSAAPACQAASAASAAPSSVSC